MLKSIISLLLGGGAGWLYYRFVGCASGACPITSNPYISMIFGSIMGILVLPDIYNKITSRRKKIDQG